MASITFKVDGITALKRDMKGRFATVRNGMLAAVHKPVRSIMDDSRSQVPIDTFALHDSAYEEAPYYEGDDIVMHFGYGGPNVQINPKTNQPTSDYAWIVHEDLSAYHPMGKAKFLEDPMMTHAPNIVLELGGDISRLFR